LLCLTSNSITLPLNCQLFQLVGYNATSKKPPLSLHDTSPRGHTASSFPVQ
jgi:hypothetical protein